MIDLKLGLNRSCDRVTRRDVLRVGSLAALGLSLPGFLQLRARASAAESQRDVSCILIWLQGGISHIDSFRPQAAGTRGNPGRVRHDRDQRAGHHALRPAAQAGTTSGQVFDLAIARTPAMVRTEWRTRT